MTAPLLSDPVDKASLQGVEAELREANANLHLVHVLLFVIACLLAVIALVAWQWRLWP